MPNNLRVLDADLNTIHTEVIETGKARSARRVSQRVADLHLLLGCPVQVETRRGWVSRYIVKVRNAYYTRVNPPTTTG
jgi:hypothetical protein